MLSPIRRVFVSVAMAVALAPAAFALQEKEQRPTMSCGALTLGDIGISDRFVRKFYFEVESMEDPVVIARRTSQLYWAHRYYVAFESEELINGIPGDRPRFKEVRVRGGKNLKAAAESVWDLTQRTKLASGVTLLKLVNSASTGYLEKPLYFLIEGKDITEVGSDERDVLKAAMGRPQNSASSPFSKPHLTLLSPDDGSLLKDLTDR